MNAACETVVAMSGGVDSSVAALLVAREGRPAAGLTLRLSDSDPASVGEGRCCAARDITDARRVADRLDLPHFTVDLRELFAETVIRPFVDAYLAGRTPIPCVACNDRVKFSDLLARARALGASTLATGHYARTERDGSRVRLLRAEDAAKDQTYFLHGLTQEQLSQARFPLGALSKDEVRALAREALLPNAEKPESQEICFVPDGNAAAFVEREAARRGIPLRPGHLVDREGSVVGTHAGVHRFTVGQRKGLGAHGAPVHVLSLDSGTATVVIGAPEELGASGCIVEHFRWVAGEAPARAIEARVQVRHAKLTFPALVTPLVGGSARIEFAEPVRAVSPGQHAVAYDGDCCLGGGAITAGVPWRREP